MSGMSAARIIEILKMQPHPEGGYFVETFRDDSGDKDAREASTAIYYLLEKGDYSHWHRVDAAEVWHFYAGAALTLSLSEDGQTAENHLLGPNLAKGERPQIVVPKGHWQSARSTGDWTLVGCTVAPGFQFSGFEMAPPDWAPGTS
ncbi:MAG: cupin domain-containing protein [Alphaproteobacteria bacterium]|nr:MAG: cupin domain-containing protein [Alphaproteobacteria bacterium]